jgi:CDP-glucose 4,6-dehydratase
MNRDQREFWAGRKVLVTGHRGYKGASLTAKLVANGADVFGFCQSAQPHEVLYSSLKERGLGPQAEVVGDVRDQQAFSAAVANFRPDTVFHLAAQPLVLQAAKDPIHTIETNVIGSAIVTRESLASPSVRTVIVAATDKVYRNSETPWPYRETDPIGGNEVYSASKAAQELVIEALALRHNPRGVKVVSIRAGNVVGGFDRAPNRIFSDIEKAVEERTNLAIRNPYATRPWFHIADAVDGYLQIAQFSDQLLSNRVFEVLNLGAHGSPVSVGEVIEFLEARVGKISSKVEFPEIHESQRLSLSTELVEAELGWRSSMSHTQAVQETIEVISLLGENPSSAMSKFIKTLGIMESTTKPHGPQ